MSEKELKINPNDPAFGIPEAEGNYFFPGLTKREYFAAMAMQGFCANNPVGNDLPTAGLVKMAVDHADALIAELNK